MKFANTMSYERAVNKPRRR